VSIETSLDRKSPQDRNRRYLEMDKAADSLLTGGVVEKHCRTGRLGQEDQE